MNICRARPKRIFVFILGLGSFSSLLCSCWVSFRSSSGIVFCSCGSTSNGLGCLTENCYIWSIFGVFLSDANPVIDSPTALEAAVTELFNYFRPKTAPLFLFTSALYFLTFFSSLKSVIASASCAVIPAIRARNPKSTVPVHKSTTKLLLFVETLPGKKPFKFSLKSPRSFTQAFDCHSATSTQWYQ